MITPWVADRWGYNPMAYEMYGRIHVSPRTYDMMVKHAAFGLPKLFDTGGCLDVVADEYISDYRPVAEPCFKGWWLK